MKSIHERVRASLEKKERDAQRKIDRANDSRLLRLERKALKEEQEAADSLDFDSYEMLLDEIICEYKDEK